MDRLCIFDLDGTLTDTLESLTYSVNETLREMGLASITSAQCREFVGNGARELIRKALVSVGDENCTRLEEGMEIYGRVFDENCTRYVKPYPGIKKLLKELKQEGTRLGVLSNKPHRQTVFVVETIFGTDSFAFVQGQKESIPRKPNPEALFRMMEEANVKKEQVVYIGDSEVDIATGKAAKVKTIGVLWGFRKREDLENAGACLIAETTEDLKYMITNEEE